MNKRKKLKQLLALSVAPVLASPIAFLSADPTDNNAGSTNSSTNGSGDTNNQGGETKPKQVSTLFDGFKIDTENALKLAFDTAIAGAVAKINDAQSRIKNDLKNPEKDAEFKENIKQSYYLQLLKDYLEKNKDKIKESPNKEGFNVIFPNVYSTRKKFKRGNVTFQGVEYPDVIFDPEISTTNYSGVIGDGDKQEATADEDNFYTKEDVTKFTNEYVNALKEGFYDIVYNSSDIPEDLQFDTSLIDAKDGKISAITSKVPEGFNSWDDYIKSKITPRYTAFDLEHNKTDQPEQNQPDKKPEDDTLEPLDPTDPIEGPIIEPTPIQTKEAVEKLPALAPKFKSELLKKEGYNIDKLVQSFQSDPQGGSDKYFWFDNPINTRYKYEVESVEKTQTGISFTVSISDTVDTEASRRYRTTPQPLQKRENYAFDAAREKFSSELRREMVQLYSAIGLDESIDFAKIGNNSIKNRLVTFIQTITKDIYTTKKYADNQANILNTLVQSLDINSSDSEFGDVSDALEIQFLSSVKTSTITKLYSYSFLIKGFEIAVSNLRAKVEQRKDLKEALTKAFAKKGYDLNIINELFYNLERDISVGYKVAEAQTFNTLSWYQRYIEVLSKIGKQFKLLQRLLNVPLVPEETEEQKAQKTKEFKDSYTQTQQVLKTERKEQNTFLVTIGSLFSIMSLAGLSLSTANLITKQKAKQKSMFKANISIIALSSIILLSAVALLVIGIIGGL